MNNKILIGEFESQEKIKGIFLEDYIGKFKKYEVLVYNDEGEFVPHFHVQTKDEKFKTCIKIDRPEYFHHGKYKGTLNSKEKKELMKFLLKNNSKNENNWETIVGVWFKNKDKPEYFIDERPDYTLLD